MNYQRNGISSNTKAGKNFEDKIYNYFDKELGIELEKQKKVEIGINSKKKHSFDFGNNWLLIECKSHTWTKSGNVPSAKMKNWSDAMFSFYLAPREYKKIFVVDMSFDQEKCITLLDYFIEHYFYLIPEEVILIDFNSNLDGIVSIYLYDSNSKKHVMSHDNLKNIF